MKQLGKATPLPLQHHNHPPITTLFEHALIILSKHLKRTISPDIASSKLT